MCTVIPGEADLDKYRYDSYRLNNNLGDVHTASNENSCLKCNFIVENISK